DAPPRQPRISFSGPPAGGMESGTNSTDAHWPCHSRMIALNDSAFCVLSLSDIGEAVTQAQSALLRIFTSVKIIFACHACESSCITLDARNPSKMARRKGDPLSGVSSGLASDIMALTNGVAVVNGA